VLAVKRRWNIAPSGNISPEVKGMLEKLRNDFIEAMNNDLNTSTALSILFELAQQAEQLLSSNNITRETLHEVDKLFYELGGDGEVKNIDDDKEDKFKGGVLGIIKKSYGNKYISADERFKLEKMVRTTEYKVIYGNLEDIIKKYIDGKECRLTTTKLSLPEPWTDEEYKEQFNWIDKWIDLRNKARKERDFTKADSIRNALCELNIIFEDKPGGITTWRRK
jgi:cysteinyl-tRNA synthetase